MACRRFPTWETPTWMKSAHTPDITPRPFGNIGVSHLGEEHILPVHRQDRILTEQEFKELVLDKVIPARRGSPKLAYPRGSLAWLYWLSYWCDEGQKWIQETLVHLPQLYVFEDDHERFIAWLKEELCNPPVISPSNLPDAAPFSATQSAIQDRTLNVTE